MAAFTAEFQPTAVSAQALIAQQGGSRIAADWRSFADKPKYSASPLEHMQTQAQEKSGHLCPRCKEGSLRRIQGKNGVFWGCSNYPHCTATYDDENGRPVL